MRYMESEVHVLNNDQCTTCSVDAHQPFSTEMRERGTHSFIAYQWGMSHECIDFEMKL
jgi:hypothetical protein